MFLVRARAPVWGGVPPARLAAVGPHLTLVSVTPEERRRAGATVKERLADRGLSRAEVARSARIDPRTLNGLISGRQWPRVEVRARIEKALDWERGEILRRARDGVESLRGYTERDLLAELHRRLRELDPQNKGLVNR